MTDESTTNYRLTLPGFDSRLWNDKLADNFRSIDALLNTIINIPQFVGIWENSTSYAVGDRVVDPELSVIYNCLVAHTSAASGTFAEDRANRTGYWSTLSGTSGSISLTTIDLGGTNYTGLVAATWGVIPFTRRVYDPNAKFDITTNRFTPGVAGFTVVLGNISYQSVSDGGGVGSMFNKNGVFASGPARQFNNGAAANFVGVPVTGIVQHNSTDYFNCWGLGTTVGGAETQTYLHMLTFPTGI